MTRQTSLHRTVSTLLRVTRIGLILLAGCGGTVVEPQGNSAALNETTWPMHPIDSRFRGANALSAGDVNKDGFMDYVTNYEFDQRYVIELHPGRNGNAREPWPSVVAWRLAARGKGADTEQAALADFDGDGNLDIVGVQGWHPTPFWEGQQAGVRLIWGPPADQVLDPNAWIDGGRIPDTIDRGHFLYAVPYDVNGDGAVDIVAGGRVHNGNDAKAAVKWIEAPLDRAQRRDPSKWQVHDIDPEQFDGHGFVLTDVDEDGDVDIADANADFDTPEDDETVHWYENPGTGSAAQRAPWTQHLIYRGDEFYFKPGLAAADLDGDGHVDLVTQTEHDIYWFRKTGVRPVMWERMVIPKDPVAQWLARPIKVGDLNGDGKPDLFGMLTHKDGVVPGDKAAAFWMEFRGDKPQTDNWVTHVVKWGSGRPMRAASFGEKWDQVQLADVDGDGDLDILANCEEWWEDEVPELTSFWDERLSSESVAVVWFENRLHEEAYTAGERDGRCVVEAEHATDLKDGSWIIRATASGYSADGYMQDHESHDLLPRGWDDTKGLEFAVDAMGGRYRLWMRRLVPAHWGPTLGGTRSNSTWVGVDGKVLARAFDDADDALDTWAWVVADQTISLTPGRHVIQLRAREGGYAVDRLLLSRDLAYVPSGSGPVETVSQH